MAVPANPHFTLLFNETASPPSIRFTDTFDYSGTTLAAQNVRGYVGVTLQTSSGTVVVYNNLTSNTPDVNHSISAVGVNLITLPLDSSGNVLQGIYTVTYQVRDVNNVVATSSSAHAYDFTVAEPEFKIKIVVDCGLSQIVSKDITDYGTYDTITRVHTIYPPAQLALPAYTNNLDTLTVSGIYTNTWTAEIITTLTYTSSGGYTYSKTISGIREFEVDCDTNLCQILCCISNIKKTYDRLINSNPSQAKFYREEMIQPVMENLMLFQAAQACGDITKMALYKDAIVDITACGSDCNCGDSSGNPVQVIPTTGVDLITVVDSPDNSIAVTTGVSGNTTIYHIQVGQAIQSIIAGMYNTTVTTATPSFLTLTASGTNPKNYNIDFIGTIPTVVKQIECQITLSRNNGAGAYALATISYLIHNGSNWIASGSHVWTAGTSSPNVALDTAIITVTNLLTSSSFNKITAHAEIIDCGGRTNRASTPFQVETFYITETTTGGVKLRIIDQNGLPVSLSDVLTKTSAVIISLSIYNV